VVKQNEALAVAYEEINRNGCSSEEECNHKNHANQNIQKKNNKIAIS
jgi:hypothetical protein